LQGLDANNFQAENKAVAATSTISLVALAVSLIGTSIAAIRFLTESPLFKKDTCGLIEAPAESSLFKKT
jgi:hypothetical protein